MKTMNAGVGVLVCLLMACASAGPQGSAAVELPTVESIMDRHLEALGGRERLAALPARLMSGRLSIPVAGLKGTVAMIQAPKARSLTAMTIDGLGSEVVGSDGERVWSLSATSGNRFLDGEELVQRLHELTFMAELYWESLYPTRVVKGEATVGEHRCWEVVMTSPAGHAYSWFFDQVTGLLVGVDGVQVSQMGKIPVKQRYFDFRDVDGVKVPFRIVVAAMGMEQVVELDVVVHPPELPAATFVPPQF